MARTVVDIDEAMLTKARRLTGLRKKVDIVNLAIRVLVQQKEVEKVLDLRGNVRWEGDLEKMREGRRGCR